jgi:hypothetical protein
MAATLDSDMRLKLPARPENVAAIGHVVGALSETAGMGVA